MFSGDLILEAIARGVESREAMLREEQAVYGLDALSELEWHPLLADALTGAGFRVVREQLYPYEWRRKPGESLAAGSDAPQAAVEAEDDTGALPLPRERQRADFVLLAPGSSRLRDEVMVRKQARRVRALGEGTLFADRAAADARAIERAALPSAVACEPEDAFWLEVKIVAQFAYTCGVPGPNRTYASELKRGLSSDLSKLAADKRIHLGAGVLVLLTSDRATAEHDVGVMTHRLLDRDLPIQPPLTASVQIQDRIGNSLCTLVLTGLSPLAHALA